MAFSRWASAPGSSAKRTVSSACSPRVRGRQFRVRGDAQVRLLGGLYAPSEHNDLHLEKKRPRSVYAAHSPFSWFLGAAWRHDDSYGHPRHAQKHANAFFDDMHSFIAAMAKRFPIRLAVIAGHPA